MLHEIFWRTQLGELINIKDMSTHHLICTVKMLYNHMAELRGWPTIWHNHQYPGIRLSCKIYPQRVLKYMIAMSNLAIRRKDFPAKYIKPFGDILAILANMNKAKIDV